MTEYEIAIWNELTPQEMRVVTEQAITAVLRAQDAAASGLNYGSPEWRATIGRVFRAQDAAKQEPVAWQWQNKRTGYWSEANDREHAEYMAEHGHAIRALVVAPIVTDAQRSTLANLAAHLEAGSSAIYSNGASGTYAKALRALLDVI
jgi:hypothetical protein